MSDSALIVQDVWRLLQDHGFYIGAPFKGDITDDDVSFYRAMVSLLQALRNDVGALTNLRWVIQTTILHTRNNCFLQLLTQPVVN